jgi:flagellar protein FlaG
MTKVASFAATPDSTFGRNPQSQSQPETAERDERSESPEDLRLIIEEDQASGAITYKTIDRRTGEVVHRYPREDLLKLSEDERYVAGGVIRTKA